MMPIDFIVSSLPSLSLDGPAPCSWEQFEAQVGADHLRDALSRSGWNDLETQLRNALAEARGKGEQNARPAVGCSLYWKKRVFDAFAERDVLKRENLLDRVWWDAAGELTPPASPLGLGALLTYAVRLRLVLKHAKISAAAGNAAFDRLTAETRR